MRGLRIINERVEEDKQVRGGRKTMVWKIIK